MLDKPLGRVKDEGDSSEGKLEGISLLKVQHRNLMSGQAGKGGWEEEHLWFPGSLREGGASCPQQTIYRPPRKRGANLSIFLLKTYSCK